MYLKQNNLVIRAAIREDAECLCNWWSDGAVMEHAGFPNGLKTDIDKLRESLDKQKDSVSLKRLIIEIDLKPVGEMCFRIDNNIAEIGIKICDVSYQEKGFGTKVLNMLITYLFKEKSVEKIVLDTNLRNTRAQHVYEKIGFKKVCVRENSWEDQLGELQSSVDYELIREEFLL